MKNLDLFDNREVSKKKIKKLKEQAENGKGIQMNLNSENPYLIIKGKKQKIEEIIVADIHESREDFCLQTTQNRLSTYGSDENSEVILFVNKEESENIPSNVDFKLYLHDGTIFKYFPEQTCSSPYDGLALYFKTSHYFGIIMLDYKKGGSPNVIVHFTNDDQTGIVFQKLVKKLALIIMKHRENNALLNPAKNIREIEEFDYE